MNGSNFAQLLLRRSDFRDSHAQKTFWSGRFEKEELEQVFSWRELNSCLSCNRITNDRFRMSTASEHEEVNRRAFRHARDRFGRTTDHLLINELHVLMREGVTGVLEAVNELVPSVGNLTETLGGTLGAQSTANAYVSFGSISGFGIHNDDHDVIVIQLEGRKRWQFFASSVDAKRKATVKDIQAPSASDRGVELVISSGDVMFVPKGTWHDVIALNEKSLHLTISLVYPTMMDFVQWGLAREKYGLSYHDIRQSCTNREELLKVCENHFQRLITSENLEKFSKTFYAGHASSRIRANFPSLNLAGEEDSFRRISFDIASLDTTTNTNEIDVYALGQIHRLTAVEYKILSQLSSQTMTRGAQLITSENLWADISRALTSLMDKGLVGKQAFV